MCRAWRGSASCPIPRHSRRADDRYAAVVALTAEKPDFPAGGAAARGDARNVRAARRGSGRHVPPRGVRPTGGRPDHHRGRRVSTRSASTPPPLAGGGWEGATPGPQSALPQPLPARGGEYRSCPPCPLGPSALRLPRTRRHRAPCSTTPSRPTSRASPPSAAKSSTARAARWHSYRPRVASGAFARTQRRRCSPTC